MYMSILQSLMHAVEWGILKRAFVLFDQCVDRGIDPDAHTYYGALINGLCKSGQVEAAEILLNEMQSKGIDAQLGDIQYTDVWVLQEGVVNEALKLQETWFEAKRILREMEKKGVKPSNVTYNAMIDGYSKKGSLEDAQKLKDEMKGEGIGCGCFTYTSLITWPTVYPARSRMQLHYSMKSQEHCGSKCCYIHSTHFRLV
ncbi:Pentatricopeptide repeat-containing protein [Cinnamomum micranthum f. kanehirae]|uniref:Pentatricopeptide repeat-containing protein n=1 Tax=Cinnamomum micranthum f. kanehirae TaxID=337451 RepID=A0A443PWK1_9MAGN|nr:Pentatricopeptide repeat-containing protein [Cinnamomum micranthum f. kanehirae]